MQCSSGLPCHISAPNVLETTGGQPASRQPERNKGVGRMQVLESTTGSCVTVSSRPIPTLLCVIISYCFVIISVLGNTIYSGNISYCWEVWAFVSQGAGQPIPNYYPFPSDHCDHTSQSYTSTQNAQKLPNLIIKCLAKHWHSPLDFLKHESCN